MVDDSFSCQDGMGIRSGDGIITGCARTNQKGHWTKEEVSFISDILITLISFKYIITKMVLGLLTSRCSEKTWRKKLEKNS